VSARVSITQSRLVTGQLQIERKVRSPGHAGAASASQWEWMQCGRGLQVRLSLWLYHNDGMSALTLNPTPYILNPTPYTLHPTLYTLNPKP